MTPNSALIQIGVTIVAAFDRKSAQRLFEWYQTDTGREILRLQSSMILNLLRLRPGERLLDVGCGPGLLMETFQKEGLWVAGVDSSPDMLALSRKRLGCGAELYLGGAEDLPFDDNAFDIVTIVNSLEFVEDPETALSEAVRVARKRLFVGVLNSISLTALGRWAHGLVSQAAYRKIRYFSLWELIRLIRKTAGPAKIRWASVGVLPPAWAGRATSFESRPFIQRLPIGSFIGVAADVAYTMRTNNLEVDAHLGFRRKGLPAAGSTSCRWHRQTDGGDLTVMPRQVRT